MIALYRKSENTITCSSALVGSVGEMLADTNLEILNVSEGNILVESLTLLENVADTFVINAVAIAVGRICVDFGSVMLVDKTAKIKIGLYKKWSKKGSERERIDCDTNMQYKKNTTFSFLSG